MKEIEEMQIVRTGKNPSNPRPSGTSKNPRDKRNAAKKGLVGSRHQNTTVDLEFDNDNKINAKSVAHNKSLISQSKISASHKEQSLVNKMSLRDQGDKGSIYSEGEFNAMGHSSP